MADDVLATSNATSNNATPQSASTSALSHEAAQLLGAANADGSGVILFERFGGGSEISANNQVFNADSSARTLALREAAIEELERRGFVKATSEKREVFEMTKDGFTAADALKA